MRLEVDSMIEVAKNTTSTACISTTSAIPAQSCYCDGCRERFQADTGLKVEKWPDECRSVATRRVQPVAMRPDFAVVQRRP